MVISKKELPVSVLMSLYHKEQPKFLCESFDSILNQTCLPHEILLVLDGEVTLELEKVVNDYARLLNIKIVRLSKNMGLGYALSKGVEQCSNELIVRMDTDDVMVNNRIESQYDFMIGHPDVDACGGYFYEFVGSTDNVVALANHYKIKHDDIVSSIGNRSPFAHPTIIIKRSAILLAGNYSSFVMQEDYYLFVKMHLAGCKFANIPQYLLYYRTDNVISRRVGWVYFLNEIKLMYFMYQSNIIPVFQLLRNASLKFVIRVLLPKKIVSLIYSKILRVNQ